MLPFVIGWEPFPESRILCSETATEHISFVVAGHYGHAH